MAKFTAVEIKNMLKNGSLTVADLEYKDVISAADGFKQQSDNESFGTLYQGMISEVSRLTAPVAQDDRALQVPAEQRVFSDSQLNQMPEMINYLEGVTVQGQTPDFSDEKNALEARVQKRLQDIKDGRETEISPLSIDDLRAMAARAGIDISAELDAALAQYAQKQDIDNISKEQLAANHALLTDFASHLDFANDEALALTKNISNGLDVAKNPEEPNANEEKDRELFRDAAVNSALAHLLTSSEFSAKVSAHDQETDASRKAALKADLAKLFKSEINAQAQTTAYAMLLQDAISDVEQHNGAPLTREDGNLISQHVDQEMDKLSKGEKVSVRFNSFMAVLAEKSASWDERVAYLSKKFIGSVIPNQVQARFSAWNQKMEQNHPKSWKYFKVAAVALKKASPSLILGAGAMLSAGTAMAVPAAAAYGAYRIARGIKPLLNKFREARKENPNVGFGETVKKNKIMAGRAILSMVAGTAGLAASAGSALAEVASSTRIGLAAGGAALSTAAAVDAWKDKKASKGRKWTETVMALVSTGLAGLGISKAVQADDVVANPALSSEDVPAEDPSVPAETPAVSEEDAGDVWVEQDEVMERLRGYNSANGMNNSEGSSWWSTRKPEELENQYNNLSDDDMEKYFPGMSREEVLMKYNRLDSWTVRVRVLPNGDLVPLENATRYHANDELAILKKIIECDETPKHADGTPMSDAEIKAAVEYMDRHITSNGDTDLPGIRNNNRIDTIKNPGCTEENEGYGKGQPTPKQVPQQEPKEEVVEEKRVPVKKIDAVKPAFPQIKPAEPDLTLEPMNITPYQPVDNVLIHQANYGNSFHYAGQMTDVEPQFDGNGRITNANDVFNTEGANGQTLWLVKNEVTGKMDAYMLQDGKTPSVAFSDDPRHFGRVAGVEYKKDLFRRDHQAVWVDGNGDMHRSGVNSKSDAFKDIFDNFQEKNLVGGKENPLIMRNAGYLKGNGR